jgi:hypothetical protein
MSHEGVFFKARGGLHASRTSSPTRNTASAILNDKSQSRDSSAASQTSLCPVHVSVNATRDLPTLPTTGGIHKILDRLGLRRANALPSSVHWGWSQAASVDEEAADAVAKWCLCDTEKDAEEEADLSGWDQCGVVYGNGLYEYGDEED